MRTHHIMEWMSAPAIVVEPTTSLAAAHQLMYQHHVRRLPVVARGKLVGIITRGDLRAAQAADGMLLDFRQWRALLNRLTVEEYMTHNPVTIAANASMLEAARLLLTHKISGVPVVEGGQVVGVISESDLLRLLITDETRLGELAARSHTEEAGAADRDAA
jgi:CBS domain-containing protein